MKGTADIPVLKLTHLRQLAMDYVAKMPSMRFTGFFPTYQLPTDEAVWEIELGSEGISPFVAPGAPAPVVGIDGLTSGRAKVAYWKEKTFFDEVFLNNLRKIGTLEKEEATRKVGKQLQKLLYRSMRRKEWMCAKALIDGRITYNTEKNAKFTVNYGRPESNTVTLGADYKWGTGANRNPQRDIMNAREHLADTFGVLPKYMMVNSTVLKLLMFDAQIQDLLKKSSFGNGDLFARPAEVVSTLFAVEQLLVVDDMYEVPAKVLAVSGATITVDNIIDFEVGGKLFANRGSEQFVGESRTITAVDVMANTITVDSAFSAPLLPGRDEVLMRKKFIGDNEVLIFTDTFNGQSIGEFYAAPFGLDGAYGLQTDTHAEYDPDGITLRVQDKGLPVIYNPQTCYKLVVA
jgi:hypothetical protein